MTLTQVTDPLELHAIECENDRTQVNTRGICYICAMGIYIYIYICVCVCVCVTRKKENAKRRDKLLKHVKKKSFA